MLAHTTHQPIENTVEVVRIFVCFQCGGQVLGPYVNTVKIKRRETSDSPYGEEAGMTSPIEARHARSETQAMHNTADEQRELDAFILSAKGEAGTKTFRKWAGGGRVPLAIVFTVMGG